uniref:Metal-dependent protein hydrolase n=1 Tax=Aegilops tauschii subsp. strangulata TaxID=200361 RepID=A0A453PAN1_AEGTS
AMRLADLPKAQNPLLKTLHLHTTPKPPQPIVRATIMLAACAWRLSQRVVTFLPRVRPQILNPFPMAAAAGATSPKRLRVYSSAAGDADSSNGAGNGRRVGTHNGSFHCDEALGCFLIRLTSQFAGADVVRTRDSQVCRFFAGSIGLPFPARNVSANYVVVASARCTCVGAPFAC